MTENSLSQKKTLNIEKYISEKDVEILDFIDKNKRVLINASPGSGKTTFFANLCTNHLQQKKAGRIIFCSPYLIIQSQFKRALEEKGVMVDLELNAKSPRKVLIPQDKIITTTYKSLRLLEKDIDKDDLVIVDEAHSLLYSYKKDGIRDFFIKTVQVLFKIQSKVVLMTGTPYQGVTRLLKLSELRIKRPEVKAKVEIEYSKVKDISLAVSFAEHCLNEFGSESLNIIYIKNTRKCENIKKAIEAEFSCKAFVLTSKRKETKVYKELEKSSLIPNDIQFLITTNVISTGANILNSNVGKALMINEFNPTEIKQFSKRFRKKPNLEIDVVNKIYLKNEGPVEAIREKLEKERIRQRFFYIQLLETFKTFYLGDEHFHFDKSYHLDVNTGSPEMLLDDAIERFVIQEAYFVEQIAKTYNTPKELVKALNRNEDVISLLTPPNGKGSSEEIDESLLVELDKQELERIIKEFIIRQNDYFKAIHHYFNHEVKDFYAKKELEIFLKKHNLDTTSLSDLEVDEEILHLLKHFDFISRILLPLYYIDGFIKNISKSLYFLLVTPPNKRKSELISLHINELYNRYLELNYFTNPIVHPPSLDIRKEVNELLLKEDEVTTAIVILIIKTYRYLVSHDYINYDDLNNYLISLKLTFPKKTNFILKEIEIDFNTQEAKNFNKNLIKGLVNGLFYIDPKQVYRKTPTGARKATYFFHKKLPSPQDAITKLQRKEREEIEEKTPVLNFQLATRRFSYPKLNPAPRIVNSHKLLVHNLMDNEFFKLLEEQD